MKFAYTDLKQQSRGTVIRVTLSGAAANVFLVDSSNFSNYKNGRRYRYYGGQARRSPVHLTIPSSGHWYLVVDLGGFPGRVNYGVEVLPGAMPAIPSSASPELASIADNVAALPGHDDLGASSDFDVFISHASEDKDAIVRPLAHALQDLGLNVWYDEFSLRLGDSLRRKIDEGLARSRFGIVVLSPAFFRKNWTQYELDGLVTRENTGQQIILPLWHELSKDTLIQHSPSLADKVALRTSDYTIDEIAAEVASVISS